MRTKRKLRLTTTGASYLGLTLALGTLAITTGNNVLYLLESFMLGGLILSGVLSEWVLRAIDIQWRRHPAIAGEPTHDLIVISNHSRIPLYCLEIGDWTRGKFSVAVFVPYIPPRSQITAKSLNIFKLRGRHEWDGVGVATRFPFGFATKYAWREETAERLIWPARKRMGRLNDTWLKFANSPAECTEPVPAKSHPVGFYGAASIVEGEVRTAREDDDYRYMIWSLSLKREDPLVRVRRAQMHDPEMILDLRTQPGPQFESRLAHLCTLLFTSHQGPLVIVEWNQKFRVNGHKRILDTLAVIQAQGDRRPA